MRGDPRAGPGTSSGGGPPRGGDRRLMKPPLKIIATPGISALRAMGWFGVLYFLRDVYFHFQDVGVLTRFQPLPSVSPRPHAETGASSSSSSTTDHNSMLLSVPFYVYEEFGLPEDATLNGKPYIDVNKPVRFEKHADDILLSLAALKHPMRTLDPEKAKLFVIPTLFNSISQYTNYGHQFCVKQWCNQELIRHINDLLGSSPWYQRHNGSDHIVVTSHWMWHSPWRWESKFGEWQAKFVQNCNSISFEDQCRSCSSHRIAFPSYYVGRACENVNSLTEKLHDFAMIASLKPNNTKFSARSDICRWIPSSPNFSMPACGSVGEQCPALAKAKFGFHVRGDTPGSNRLMDTILSGTVPVFTDKNQYKILPPWIDWESISVYADAQQDRESFLKSLTAIVNDTALYLEKSRNVSDNKALFDFYANDGIVVFDTYMYMFQAHIWPEQRTAEGSPYGTLILPQKVT